MNDPADPGGSTKYGISQRAYPNLDITNLTLKGACDIYYRDWWTRLKCDQVESDVIALKLMDTSINVGYNTGIKILQKALKAVGCPVTVDGKIGPQTLGACNKTNEKALIGAMRVQQKEHYQRVIARNPKLVVFKNGWFNRAES